MSGDTWSSDEVVQECVTRALAASLTPQTKILLSQRGLQFAEDYSNSIQRLELNRASAVLANPSEYMFLKAGATFVFCGMIDKVHVCCSVLSLYEGHQKLLHELGGTKKGAENG